MGEDDLRGIVGEAWDCGTCISLETDADGWMPVGWPRCVVGVLFDDAPARLLYTTHRVGRGLPRQTSADAISLAHRAWPGWRR